MKRVPIIIGLLVLIPVIGFGAFRVLGPVTQRVSANYHHLFDPTASDSEYDQILERNRVDVRGGDLRVQQLADWTNLSADREALDELEYVWTARQAMVATGYPRLARSKMPTGCCWRHCCRTWRKTRCRRAFTRSWSRS